MLFRRIYDLREDRDLKQRELAAYLVVDQSLYSKYERGEREVPARVILRLARYYDVSADYLLGLTDDPCHAPRKSEE